MGTLTNLPGINLFTSLPSSTLPKDPTAAPIKLVPIPIPTHHYKSRKPPQPSTPPPNSDTLHLSESQPLPKYDEKTVIFIGNGSGFLLPGAPFPFQKSYSEIPNQKPIGIRYPKELPFATHVKHGPWTWIRCYKKRENLIKIKLISTSTPPPPGMQGARVMRMQEYLKLWDITKEKRSREEILGPPLTEEEKSILLERMFYSRRQINLGRLGLNHNSLDYIHTQWKMVPLCKIRCKGVSTVDMDNICNCLEEKTGGKIIHRVGGLIFLFRGRNYNSRTRPRFPLLISSAPNPIYPPLIEVAPEGLSKDEADELRRKGKGLPPFIKLIKNGVYLSLLSSVRDAFEESPLVKIGCWRWRPGDIKKLGVKLKELVPCVLLSFDNEEILVWRGKDWKSMYPECSSFLFQESSRNVGTPVEDIQDQDGCEDNTESKMHILESLWKDAIESGDALFLAETNLSPDALVVKVKELEKSEDLCTGVQVNEMKQSDIDMN